MAERYSEFVELLEYVSPDMFVSGENENDMFALYGINKYGIAYVMGRMSDGSVVRERMYYLNADITAALGEGKSWEEIFNCYVKTLRERNFDEYLAQQ
ncbi:hypothetical protein CMI47_18735 [Candidatus Pacearchaeota archaeon]|nr:hypothetical protein [Candidatus Pacearchaeota archaeon]|tara:strand:- start:1470 stop:1763 length:294 start_codon:yes stop_codon:yes gene_type:complete